MDLKAYYRKLREIERGIAEEFLVMKSLATPDGGVAGRLTEVSRAVAARAIAEGSAEPASAAEAAAYRVRKAEEKEEEEERRASEKMQFVMVKERGRRAVQKGRRGKG